MPKYSEKSKQRLEQCHEDLQTLFNEVINHIDVSIICGYRGEEEQNKAFNAGHSKLKYPKSKHNKIPSLAVDVYPYPEGIKSVDKFKEIAVKIKELIEELKATGKITSNIVWGGDWKMRDYPHWEIKA